MSKQIKPLGDRILVQILEDKEKYATTSGGVLVEAEEERKAHVTVRAEILDVGPDCVKLTKDQIGLVVIIHEYVGTKIKSIKSKELRIINELDAQGYEY